MANQFLHIQQPGQKVPSFALFNLGFRPFFLFAAIFAAVSILVWGGLYVYGWPAPHATVAPMQWHAHEMIFGYAMAVVAGFLLTAVRNWTNIPTLRGSKLAALLAAWLAARVLMLVAPGLVLPIAILDVGFNIALAIAIAIPLVQAKQMKQLGIVSKIVLLGMANALFYLGALGLLDHGVRWGLYSGLYLILSLIFVMARRVVPFFIERGVGYPVQLTNRTWVDRSSLVLLLLFWIVDVFLEQAVLAGVLAMGLFAVHVVRLADWHTPGVWKKPLLWVLFLGYGGAISGFLLKALTPVVPLPPYLAVHAFAVGGIGLMTVGMMARVALGHTGRSIQEPPRVLAPIFFLLAGAFVVRVLLPMFDAVHYVLWVGVSQALWLTAFGLLAVIYAPILIKARVDGQPG
jgi:uncharacterized protein involved in response to NO